MDQAPVARKKLLEDLEALLQELNLGEEPKKRIDDLIGGHLSAADLEEKENETFADFLANRGMNESEIGEALRMARGQRGRADADAEANGDAKGKDRMPSAGAHHGYRGAMDRRLDRRFGTARILSEPPTERASRDQKTKAAIGPSAAAVKRTSDKFGLDRIRGM
jgi:hypothetical protein